MSSPDPNARFTARAAGLRRWLGVEWGVEVTWAHSWRFPPRATGVVFRGPALDALADRAKSDVLARKTSITEEGLAQAASDWELARMIAGLEDEVDAAEG